MENMSLCGLLTASDSVVDMIAPG